MKVNRTAAGGRVGVLIQEEFTGTLSSNVSGDNMRAYNKNRSKSKKRPRTANKVIDMSTIKTMVKNNPFLESIVDSSSTI
jgi:hypothetical protein